MAALQHIRNNITMKMLKRCILILLSVPHLLFAQQDNIISHVIHKDNTLKLSPFHFITSTFMLGLEHATGETRTIQIFPGITFAEESNLYNAKDVFGLSVEVHYRIYLEKGAKRLMGSMNNKLSGLYGAPYLFYKQISMDKEITYFSRDCVNPNTCYITQDILVEAWSVGGGLIMGYQFIINNAAVLDFFGGGGVKYSVNNIENSINGYYITGGSNRLYGFNTGVVPNFGFLLGVYF
ncbi:MAG: DUF3575 domain-containing protein [Bacteroidetes bacterium]|nr:DUF3575 domain-containing protein [Bacteroidota bacterium]